MTIYNFEINNGAFRMWDDDGKTDRMLRPPVYPMRIFSKIFIYPTPKVLTIGNIGTIDGVVPTDINDAMAKLNDLAKRTVGEGNVTPLPIGAATESKQDQQITAISNLNANVAKETTQQTGNNVLGSQGANPPTIKGTGILGYIREMYDLYISELDFRNNKQPLSLINSDVIETDNTNTYYLMKSFKKLASASNNKVKIVNISVSNDGSNDNCLILLLKNPTYNNTVTYTTNGLVQESNEENRTITNVGEVIATKGIYRSGNIDLDVTMLGVDDYALAVKPLSSNQDNFGTVNLEFL